MHPTEQDDGSLIWWCHVCDRQIQTRAEGGFKVIEQGNFDAQHYGSTHPELIIGTMEIRK